MGYCRRPVLTLCTNLQERLGPLLAHGNLVPAGLDSIVRSARQDRECPRHFDRKPIAPSSKVTSDHIHSGGFVSGGS